MYCVDGKAKQKMGRWVNGYWMDKQGGNTVMKSGFSLEEHQQIGKGLHTSREYLIAALLKISKAYPLKVSSKLDKAINIIDRLRSDLDDCILKEHCGQGDIDLTRIYYPGDEQR